VKHREPDRRGKLTTKEQKKKEKNSPFLSSLQCMHDQEYAMGDSAAFLSKSA